MPDPGCTDQVIATIMGSHQHCHEHVPIH